MQARRLLLVLSLATLLLAEARSFRRWELKRRVLLLAKLAALPVATAEASGEMYVSDRQFSLFLDGVRRRVPAGSSVAVALPPTTPLYLYTANYALAPRPVFDARSQSPADFLAIYDPTQPGAPAGAWAVPGGTLRPLR